MSIPFNQDSYSYVLPGGEITLQAMFQTYLGSGLEQPVSNVQLTITPVGGGAPVAGPLSPLAIDSATYSYQWLPPQSTPAGDYIATWTCTGASTITQVVTVVPLPQESPAPGLYATVAQYQQWASDQLTPVDLISQYLVAASETMDLALIGAVYPTDADGQPTQPAHISVFQRACCAQVQWLIANGDIAGVKSQYASTAMGGITQTRTARAQGSVLPTLAPRAASILQTAGVLATAPLINW